MSRQLRLILVGAAILALAGAAQAELLFVDSFDYTEGTALDNYAGTPPADPTNTPGWEDRGSRDWVTTSPGLTYPGVISSGLSGGRPDTGSGTEMRKFHNDLKQDFNITSGTIYAAFLGVRSQFMDVLGWDSPSGWSAAEFMFGLNPVGNLYTRVRGPGGIDVEETGSTVYDISQTYLLAARIVFADGPDEVSFLVNPNTANPDWASGRIVNTADLTSDEINIVQAVANTSMDGGGHFDEFRLATTWEEAVGGVVTAEFTNVDIADATMLEFASDPGLTYRLDSAPTPMGPFDDLGVAVDGDGTPKLVFDPNEPGGVSTSKTYRIRVLVP